MYHQSSKITQLEVERLLSHTESLLSQTFWVKQKFNVLPDKDHIGISIGYTDVTERRVDFLKCLTETINSFVYNKKESSKLIKKFFKESHDYAHAAAKLTFTAANKFRPGHPQGQFGELLLFNFIQHFFKASPLLRKMKYTTSNKHERFGADAIHYKTNEKGENIFIIGESKCYKSNYKFNTAFKDSLNSIKSSFENIFNELDLYIYEENMIEQNLIKTAEDLKKNVLGNVKFELVCIIIYNENRIVNNPTELEIKARIKQIIEERFHNLDKSIYKDIDDIIISRINYIVFPIWDLNNVLNDFMNIIKR
jgi:hypothetical protein